MKFMDQLQYRIMRGEAEQLRSELLDKFERLSRWSFFLRWLLREELRAVNMCLLAERRERLPGFEHTVQKIRPAVSPDVVNNHDDWWPD